MKTSRTWVFGLALCAAAAQGQDRTNHFDDPFVQVTTAIPGCRCFRVGRCRLPNSYLYDKEIIPRVQKYIQLDGRFDDTSVWVLGERRLVTLMGCVKSKEQADQLEKAVLLVDDVMGVVNFLSVGSTAKPGYRLAR